jgi:hypothetical protein
METINGVTGSSVFIQLVTPYDGFGLLGRGVDEKLVRFKCNAINRSRKLLLSPSRALVVDLTIAAFPSAWLGTVRMSYRLR